MAQSNTTDGTFEERAALYYPYIHIRSENWLKSALLAFQKVNRIVPYAYTLSDDQIIGPYSELKGSDGEPLLAQANSQTARVREAQQLLFAQMKQHEAALVARYAFDCTPEEFRSGDKAFQMHRMKILEYPLSEWLVQKKLAWNTRAFQERNTFDWLTMHPRLGSAIMSILALVVARQDGLKVVTPSRLAHQTLLANTQKQVLEKLLEVPIPFDEEEGEKVTPQELCQLVLVTGFDLTRLTPEDIRDIVVKGGPQLRKFYGKLNGFAGNIPDGIDQATRTTRLKAKAEEVLADWRECTEKLPQLKEAVKEGATDKGLEKAVDLAKEAVAVYSLVHFLGGVQGVALAIAVKAGSFMLRKRDTPYAFLNTVEKLVDKRIGSLYVPQWRELAS